MEKNKPKKSDILPCYAGEPVQPVIRYKFPTKEEIEQAEKEWKEKYGEIDEVQTNS